MHWQETGSRRTHIRLPRANLVSRTSAGTTWQWGFGPTGWLTCWRLNVEVPLYRLRRSARSGDRCSITSTTLADDDNIVLHNNHGLYQASGQLAAATRLSGLPAISQFRKQAVDRFERMFAQQFSSEGVHLEHSPGYHRLVTDLVSGIASSGLLAEFPSLSGRIEGFEDVLAWMILPNGRLANLGDTDYQHVLQEDFTSAESPLLEYVLSGGQSGQAVSQRLGVFPESGLAVLRSGWPDAASFDQASYLAQQAGFHSRTHKHADDLSFIWYERGSEILIDAGRYGYLGRTKVKSDLWNRGFWYSDPKRIYVESTRSHNTVEIDGMSFDRRKSPPYGSAIEDWGEIPEGLLFVETRAPQLETMHHSRLLVLNPANWLLVYDRVWDDASEEHDYRQWFHFAPDLTVEPRDEGTARDGGAPGLGAHRRLADSRSGPQRSGGRTGRARPARVVVGSGRRVQADDQCELQSPPVQTQPCSPLYSRSRMASCPTSTTSMPALPTVVGGSAGLPVAAPIHSCFPGPPGAI